MRTNTRISLAFALLAAASLPALHAQPGTGPISGGGGGAGVTGLTSCADGTAIADNAILRGDGTTKCQGSPVTVADTTGAISGAQSITGGTSGTSTLTLDGDSSVSGSASINGAGRLTVPTGSDGGVLIGSTLWREAGGGLAATDAAISLYRTITGLNLIASGDVNASGVMTTQELRLNPGAVGSCGSGEKGHARVAADGTFCTCNGTVWTATPATGSCT